MAAIFNSLVATRSVEDSNRPGFRAALRPAPVLDAEGVNRDAPGTRGHDHVHAEHAILLPALHDVARLHVHLFVRDVLNGKLIHLARLVDDDLALRECFGERQNVFAGETVGAVYEEDGEVLVSVRAGDAITAGVCLCGRTALFSLGERRERETHGHHDDHKDR
ncbi:MAG TPA: hypothetical protein VE775_06995, partial [Pyrinomonadaceae bacterium]|nr:hypothetical protein [Pyrinomonadaceae bacterium]